MQLKKKCNKHTNKGGVRLLNDKSSIMSHLHLQYIEFKSWNCLLKILKACGIFLFFLLYSFYTISIITAVKLHPCVGVGHVI